MPLILHAADIHLDSPLKQLDRYEGAPAETLRGATRRAFENLIDLALDRNADLLLLSGDLYDMDWRDYNTGLFLIRQLGRLREINAQVFIVSGNHDAASRITKTLRLPENARIFSSRRPETVPLENLGIAVHGQSFPKAAEKRNLAEKFPRAVHGLFNIGMLHTCAAGREGHAPYAPCSLDDLKGAGYDYWALGHVHRREILSESPFIVYPGNLQGRHIRETGPKGCMIAEISENGSVQADFVPLDVIRWETAEADISEAGDGFDAVELATERIQNIFSENEEMPLAIRTVFSGTSGAGADLTARPEFWINELRARVMDETGGRVWLEKMKIRPPLPDSAGTSRPAPGPMNELMEIVQKMLSDHSRLQAVGETALKDLCRKLPPGLKEGEGGFDLRNDRWLEQTALDAVSLLRARLESDVGMTETDPGREAAS